VEEPEMDATMSVGRAVLVVGLLLFASVLGLGATGFATAHPNPTTSSAVVGNITGKNVLAYNAAAYYFINATGGPAFAANGSKVGNLTYYASVTADNLTGVAVIPSTSGFANATAQRTQLSVGNITEVVTIVVEIASVYKTANVSVNLTYQVNVVQPYVLSLSLVSDSSSTILGFVLAVDLDGTPVGTISVPSLTAKQSYVATFQYATTGLSAGEHTFTVSLTNEHGLVTFAGGSTSYSESFYVPGAPPNYTLWYVAGAVAFFGAIFIFVTRVAARRRAPARK
jgi:hypothetical protein